jgi:hypothetical protein
LHLTKPEVGDPWAWKDLGWLGQLGEALHNYFVQRYAEALKEHGYETQTEVEINEQLGEVLWDARIDLIARKDNKTIIYDFKFVSPSVVYTANFPAHQRQIAIYSSLVDAHAAVLVYVDRTNPTRYNQIVFTDQDLIRIQTEAWSFVRFTKSLLRNPEMMDKVRPPYPPNTYPCKFATKEGIAYCPFYKYCHGNSKPADTLMTIAGDPTVAGQLKSLISAYIDITNAINEVEAELTPLKKKQESLKAQLIELLPPNQPVETDEGSILVKQIQQQRLDTDAAKQIFQSLGVDIPVKTVVMNQIVLNLRR